MALRVMAMAEMRLEVLLEVARSGESVAAVCRRHGISRETYCVYRRRFQAEGIEGLESRSRQPVNQPQRMPAPIEERVCLLRKEHPKWGARRIRTELLRKGVKAPAVSSIHRALVLDTDQRYQAKGTYTLQRGGRPRKANPKKP
jgi:transposase